MTMETGFAMVIAGLLFYAICASVAYLAWDRNLETLLRFRPVVAVTMCLMVALIVVLVIYLATL